MPQKLLASAFVLLLAFRVSAQNYTSFSIPDSISKKADAVIQLDEKTIDFVNQSKMVVHVKKVITVYNKNADFLSDISISYNKYRVIKSVSASVYGLLGNKIKTIKKRNFSDYSATGNEMLYTDSRFINYQYIPKSYPYTISYEYEIVTKNTALIPSWVPISYTDVGVMKSKYTFTYPETYTIQKSEQNFENYPITKNETAGSFSYTLQNVPPLKKESLSPSYQKIIPILRLASTQFSLAGIKGDAHTWDEFGKWMYTELVAPRNNLSEGAKARIRNLVKGVDDPIERAKIIYEYVQNKTRYISVQIGIGGWQPMFTNDVDKLGYGDCKALTFYTKSLMDVAEVPAFYSVVYADENKKNINKDVVSVQGNHAFLCLPREKDTIWLECTSQKKPFGYKNSSTDDRDVLVFTGNGAKIVHTNTNNDSENLQNTTASYTLKKDMSIAGSIDIKSYGTQYNQHLYLAGLTTKELDEALKDYFAEINNLTLHKIEVQNKKEALCFEEQLTFSANHYAIVNSDGSVLLSVNAFNRITFVPKRETNRKTDFEIIRGYQDVDEYTITLPDGFVFSGLPKPIELQTLFGNYQMSLEKLSDNTLVYKRTFLLNKGLYDKDLYSEYRAFRKKIKKYDTVKILLHQK